MRSRLLNVFLLIESLHPHFSSSKVVGTRRAFSSICVAEPNRWRCSDQPLVGTRPLRTLNVQFAERHKSATDGFGLHTAIDCFHRDPRIPSPQTVLPARFYGDDSKSALGARAKSGRCRQVEQENQAENSLAQMLLITGSRPAKIPIFLLCRYKGDSSWHLARLAFFRFELLSDESPSNQESTQCFASASGTLLVIAN